VRRAGRQHPTAASLRDVIAFPKTQSATEPMSDTLDVVDEVQPRDLHIRAVVPEKEAAY